MLTRVWWMRWQERGETVEVMTCLRHTRALRPELSTSVVNDGQGGCELCVAENEVLRELVALPGIPEPVRT